VQTVDREELSAGGKGVNVARALRLLGINSRVHTLVAGSVGELVCDLAAKEGLSLVAARVSGQTRIATLVLDGESDECTVVNPPGPAVSEENWRAFVGGVLEEMERNRPRVVICAGSLPKQVPSDSYQEIVRAARAAGATTMVDVSGDVLAATLQAMPAVVKVNRTEAVDLVAIGDRNSPEISNSQLADVFLRRGAKRVVLTLGSEGAFASDGYESIRVKAPSIKFANPTGAGDAFLAALCAAHLEDTDLASAVVSSVALSAASVEIEQPASFVSSRFQTLLNSVRAD
jgi:tagatose 6-phosphate kinase